MELPPIRCSSEDAIFSEGKCGDSGTDLILSAGQIGVDGSEVQGGVRVRLDHVAILASPWIEKTALDGRRKIGSVSKATSWSREILGNCVLVVNYTLRTQRVPGVGTTWDRAKDIEEFPIADLSACSAIPDEDEFFAIWTWLPNLWVVSVVRFVVSHRENYISHGCVGQRSSHVSPVVKPWKEKHDHDGYRQEHEYPGEHSNA